MRSLKLNRKINNCRLKFIRAFIVFSHLFDSLFFVDLFMLAGQTVYDWAAI